MIEVDPVDGQPEGWFVANVRVTGDDAGRGHNAARQLAVLATRSDLSARQSVTARDWSSITLREWSAGFTFEVTLSGFEPVVTEDDDWYTASGSADYDHAVRRGLNG